jgi:hypothetical protein
MAVLGCETFVEALETPGWQAGMQHPDSNPSTSQSPFPAPP